MNIKAFSFLIQDTLRFLNPFAKMIAMSYGVPNQKPVL